MIRKCINDGVDIHCEYYEIEGQLNNICIEDTYDYDELKNRVFVKNGDGQITGIKDSEK